MPPAVDRLLTVAQAAELLATTERFPRRLIAERRIRFVRLGGTCASLNRRCGSSSNPARLSLFVSDGSAARSWRDGWPPPKVRLRAEAAVRPISGIVHRTVRAQADRAVDVPNQDRRGPLAGGRRGRSHSRRVAERGTGPTTFRQLRAGLAARSPDDGATLPRDMRAESTPAPRSAA